MYKNKFLLGILLLLTACQSNTNDDRFSTPAPASEQDAAPNGMLMDVSLIPDATVKSEAKSRYGNPQQYSVFGKSYSVLESAVGYKEQGYASWYGTKFHGRRTSSGEPYDMYAMTAAHKSLPLPSYVRVTNLENQKQVVLKVNDRGPFVDERIIDLSYVAAQKLDILEQGTAYVEVEALFPDLDEDGKMEIIAASDLITDTTATSNDLSSITTPDSAVSDGRYLQAAAFSNRDYAADLSIQLQQVTTTPVLISNASNNNRAPWYRVLIGPLDDTSDINALSEVIARITDNEPFMAQ